MPAHPLFKMPNGDSTHIKLERTILSIELPTH